MKQSLDESLFLTFSKEKGLAKKTFDIVFGIQDKEFDYIKKILKKEIFLSPYSLNKASIFLYGGDLDDNQNKIYFILLAFLFQAEKFSQPCIPINKLLDYLDIPLDFFENLTPFYFKDNFDIPIIFSLDSLYFEKYYESEKMLAGLIYPLLKQSLVDDLNLSGKIFSNKITLIGSSSIIEDCNLIESLFLKQTVHKFLLLFPSELSYIRLKSILRDYNFESKILSDISYAHQTISNSLETELNDYIILIYDSHLLDIFDFELLFSYFSDADRFICIGNPSPYYYLSRFIFSQMFQLSPISSRVSFKDQNLDIKNFLNQWEKNEISTLTYQKSEITQIEEGFHFVDSNLLEDVEDCLFIWSKKFRNQNSIIVSPFKIFYFNNVIRSLYGFKDEEVQKGEPIIFSQNYVDACIFKGYFTYYQEEWKNYVDSFQTAYVVSPNLVINNEWDNICFLYTLDLMEDFDLVSMVYSILSKTKKSFTFIGEKSNLKNFNCKSSLGCSNLIERLKIK